jgi:hypothetical protein
LLQLTDDPAVAPVRVLARKTHDQLAHVNLERRPARRTVRVRPAARDQTPVPAPQRRRRYQK